jgi:hypothetical protein
MEGAGTIRSEEGNQGKPRHHQASPPPTKADEAAISGVRHPKTRLCLNSLVQPKKEQLAHQRSRRGPEGGADKDTLNLQNGSNTDPVSVVCKRGNILIYRILGVFNRVLRYQINITLSGS